MGGFLLGEFMSNTYRLDIQVNADSANTALGNLKEHFDKIEQSSGKAGVGINGFSDKADKASKSSKKAGDEAKKASNAQKGLAASFKEATAVAAVGFAAISGTVALSIGKANEFESALAGISKVVDFKSPDGLKDMRAELEALSTQIPLTFTELAQITAAGGQLGVAEENLIAFTKLTADMATAFDISAESAGDSMAKLANIFSKPIEEMGEFGDMINTISNNMPAKASEIVESLTRIGGTAKAFGLAEKEAVALTSAMISLGKAPEVASTAINSMLTTLSTLDVADKDVAASLKAMGLNAQEFGKTIREDGYKAIMQLLEGIEQLPKDQKIGIVTDLFGKNFGDDIVQLAGAPDVLEKINELLAEQQGYIGSMAQEAKNVSSTSEARNQMFLNSLENASAALGEVFKPALDSVRDAVIPVLNAFADFTKENPTFVAAIVGIAGAFTGVLTILGGVLAVLPILASGWAILTAGATVAVAPILGVVAAIAAVVAVGALLYDNWDLIKAKGQEIWAAVSDYASQAWESIQQAWQGVGEWFGELWDKVKQTFFNWLSQMPKPVQDMVANIGEIFSTIVDVAGAVWDGIANIAKSVWHAITKFVSYAIDKIKPIIKSVLEFFKNAWDGLVGIAKTVWQAVVSVVSHVFDKISGIISTQFEVMKAIFMAGVTIFASIFNAGFEMVKTIFSTAFKVITAVLTGDMQGVKDAIKDGFQKAVDIFKKLVGNIVDALKKLGKDLLQVGRDAMQGFINGISEKIGAAVSKAKQMASSVKNAITGFFDIHSPSRVMKQVGGWISEGLAIGIAYKAPIAAKEAKNLAKSVKNDLESELQKTAEEIFLTKQHIAGNPYAQLTKDIAFGKYGKQDTSRLQKLAQEQILQSNILTLTQQLHEAQQNLANVGLTSIEIMQRQYDETDKSVRASLDLFEQVKKTSQELIDATNRHEATQEFESTLKDIKKQMAIMGSQDPLAEFLYDLQNADKYAYYTTEQLATLKDEMIKLQAAKDAKQASDGIEESLKDINKQLALLGSNHPLDDFFYELEQTDKYAHATTDEINELIDAIFKLQNAKDALNAKQAFDTLMKDTALANETPAQRLQREYDEKMAVIDRYEQMHSDKLENATSLRQQITERYEQAEKDAKVKNYQEHLTAFAGFLKNTAGEQSKAYRVMFAASKAYALADVGVKMGKAVADAWADPSAVTIWQKLANVAKVSLEQGHVLSMINAISPKGFATGGYTGNMGINQVAGVVHGQEYVLNAKATKRIGVGNLERLNRGDGIGGHVNHINVHVTVNSDGSNVQADTQMGKTMGEAMAKIARQVVIQESKQNGHLDRLYRR